MKHVFMGRKVIIKHFVLMKLKSGETSIASIESIDKIENLSDIEDIYIELYETFEMEEIISRTDISGIIPKDTYILIDLERLRIEEIVFDPTKNIICYHLNKIIRIEDDEGSKEQAKKDLNLIKEYFIGKLEEVNKQIEEYEKKHPFISKICNPIIDFIKLK